MASTFHGWVVAAFDHPVTDPQWYWGDELDAVWTPHEGSDRDTVRHLTRLFNEPQLLRTYSLEQVGQAIWFLISDSSPAQPTRALIHTDVPLEERVACVRAMANFFREFVAPAAPGPHQAETDSFHSACYMWWDILPSWGGPDAEPALVQAYLDTMGEVLAIPCELCQLSALHGLNHWHLHHAAQVEQAIDRFLERPNASPSMRKYAAIARVGGAQ